MAQVAGLPDKKTTTQKKEKYECFRFTFTATDAALVERVCSEINENCDKRRLRCRGPIRLPTRFLRCTVRKSPCGEGTNTWDRSVYG